MNTRPDHFDRDLSQLSGQPSLEPAPRFVSSLEQRLLETFQRTTMPQHLFDRIFGRPLVPLSALALVAALVLVGTAVFLGPEGLPSGIVRNEPAFDKIVTTGKLVQGDIQLLPTKKDSLGVEPDTHFVLKTKSPIALASVKQTLAFSPNVPFTVKAQGDTDFEIIPKSRLKAGQVYAVALGSTAAEGTNTEKQTFSWAFQAKQELQIDGMLPRNKATGVPVDTGIEVTFNTDKVYAVEKYFSVDPATPGKFEKHGRVIAFVPNERLKPATVYTVTVKKGLPVLESATTLPADVVARFETAAAQEGAGYFYAAFSRAFTAAQPSEPPVVEFNAYGDAPSKPKVAVFRFKDSNDLIERFKTIDTLPTWATAAQGSATIATDGLTKVGDYELKAESNVLIFPAGFDAGYYLVDLTLPQAHLQTALVVSQLASSLVVSQTDSVLWLYDLQTKQPLVEAEVDNSLDGKRLKSDDRGLVQLPTPSVFLRDDPERTRSYFTVTAKNGRQTIVPVAVSRAFAYESFGPWASNNSQYWNHLWPDRTLYRPTDTVNVWGVVRDRQQPKTEEVSLEVWTWNYVNGQGDYIPLVQQSAKTGPSGTFAANLKLEQLKPGYYSLSLKVGGKTLATKSFEVKTFIKPAYRTTVTPDRLAVIDGDKVTYTIQTEFFDGTPAPLIKLRYGEYSGGTEGPTVVTDEQGRARVTQTLGAGDRGYGRSRHFSVFPSEPAEGDISGETDVFVYPSAVTFTPEATLKGDEVKVALTLRAVNLDDRPEQWWIQRTETGKPVPNATIRGTVFEQVMNKTKIGSEYDFIEKRVVDYYSYNYADEQRSEFSGTTNDQGVFEKTLTLTGGAYRIELTAADDQGREITRSAYVYRGSEQILTSEARFSLQDGKQPPPGSQTYTPHKYKLGESTEVIFFKDGKVATPTGQFMFVKLQNGIREVTVTDKPQLPFAFAAEDVPNVVFTAVWFDGSGFRAPPMYSTLQLQFDEQSRRLTLAVKPDKASYAPGETARLTVSVKDADGKPVRAVANLSAIDEAINAIQWENAPTPLETLYQPVRSGLLELYVSHRPIQSELGAERGGGGGDMRKDFRDAPLFTEIETDEDGRATVSFKLPDNITSWRVTTQALTNELFAGTDITMVPVTKPVFGTLTMNDEYLASDKPTVIARAYGSALKTSQGVSFTLEVPGLGQPEKRSGKAFIAEAFSPPALKIGRQEIRLTVQVGEHKDQLVRTFTVVASRLTKGTSRYLDATPSLTLTGSPDERTTLVFSDQGRGRVVSSLETLTWLYGKRLDRQLAAVTANELLQALKVRPDAPDTGFSPFRYQQEDGGLSLVVYGDSELPLTALASARADLFDRQQLRRYFVTKLETRGASREEIGWSLLGLANLQEPVLPDLDSFLKLGGLTDEEKLTAGQAYLVLGAHDQAAVIAAELLKDYGQTQEPFIRLNLGETNDDHIVNTARFALLAEGLKLPERVGIARYLEENFPKDTITNLQRVLALKQAAPLLDDQPVTVKYRVNGQEDEVTLAKGETKMLSLTPDELKTFSVVSTQGPVGLAVLSTTPFDIDQAPKDPHLSIERSYAIVGDFAPPYARPIQQGDIVRIDVTTKVTSGLVEKDFLVIDSLPSGLVLVSKPWERNLDTNGGYPLEVAGQRLTFHVWRSHFFYYARVLTPGVFTAEPAVLQGMQSSGVANYSGGQSLEIR